MKTKKVKALTEIELLKIIGGYTQKTRECNPGTDDADCTSNLDSSGATTDTE